jgi:hypothetical protein
MPGRKVLWPKNVEWNLDFVADIDVGDISDPTSFGHLRGKLTHIVGEDDSGETNHHARVKSFPGLETIYGVVTLPVRTIREVVGRGGWQR